MHGSVRLVMGLLALTAGCMAVPRAPAPQPQVNLAGFSVAFKQGYADGCEHARSVFARKDEQRFQRDVDYALGWNDGYSICRRRDR